ncbi:MAG: hypothetical protein R2795_14945 [Saprospiraceae bacterium]
MAMIKNGEAIEDTLIGTWYAQDDYNTSPFWAINIDSFDSITLYYGINVATRLSFQRYREKIYISDWTTPIVINTSGSNDTLIINETKFAKQNRIPPLLNSKFFSAKENAKCISNYAC